MWRRSACFFIATAWLCMTGFSCPELQKMHATAYCDKGLTYSGAFVRQGICATGDKEFVGDVVVLYQRLPDNNVGNMIGIYEIKDTGCNKNVIDVWCPDLESCQDFMDSVYADECGGKVWAQIVEGNG